MTITFTPAVFLSCIWHASIREGSGNMETVIADVWADTQILCNFRTAKMVQALMKEVKDK